MHRKEQKQSTYAHILPPKPEENMCVVCGKMCKSSSGLKQHMKIHKDAIPQTDAVHLVKITSFICGVHVRVHVCVCMYACMHVCMYVCMHCMHVCMYMYMYVFSVTFI